MTTKLTLTSPDPEIPGQPERPEFIPSVPVQPNFPNMPEITPEKDPKPWERPVELPPVKEPGQPNSLLTSNAVQF